MLQKLFILISGLFCVLFFQNCGANHFESSGGTVTLNNLDLSLPNQELTNLTSQSDTSSNEFNNSTSEIDPSTEENVDSSENENSELMVDMDAEEKDEPEAEEKDEQAAPVVNEPINPSGVGDVAKYCDSSKPLCGMMYGVAISGDSYGHTKQYKHSAIIRFQAEKVGKIVAYKHLNRVYRKSEWDRDDNNNGYNEKYKCKNSDVECKLKVMKNGGYHEGSGGRLQFALHEDNGKGEPSEKALAYGKKTIVPTYKNQHYVGTLNGVKYYVGDITYEHIEWEKPVSVELGKYYHIVIRQLEPEKGLVVLDGFRTNDVPIMPGGPYYGRRYRVSIKGSASQALQNDTRIFPDFKLHYQDGVVGGTGNEGVGGQYSKYKVQGQNMVRQVFTMDYTAQMSGLWVKGKHSSGSSPLIITVKNADGSVVSQISSPASKFLKAKEKDLSWMWFYNKFSSSITLIKGRKYFVEFKTNSSTSYSIQTEETFDYNGGTRLSKESVWKGAKDRAEYSTAGESSFKPIPLSIKDLPILFTVKGFPEQLR